MERRHSKKRDEIRKYLASTTAHPSAAQIYEALKTQIPELSLGTVYRNLAGFREDGEVITVAVVDGEERFDYDTSPHQHFICKKCGRVVDVRTPALGEETLTRLQHDTGVEIHSHALTLYGHCENCK